jgi:hypothetical protein
MKNLHNKNAATRASRSLQVKAAMAQMTAGCALRLVGNSAHGAGVFTGTAINALFFADDVLCVALLDGLNGARRSTSAAAYAIAADFVCHDQNLQYVCLGTFYKA